MSLSRNTFKTRPADDHLVNRRLGKIAADELQLMSASRDGTLRKPVTIWVVRHDNYVFARSWHGRTSSWFGGVQDGHQGHIRAGSVDKDVTFIDFEESDDVNHEIDATYRAKSERYPAQFVDPMVAPDARLDHQPVPAPS